MFGLKPEPEQGLTDEEANLLEQISDKVHEEMVASGTDSIAAARSTSRSSCSNGTPEKKGLVA